MKLKVISSTARVMKVHVLGLCFICGLCFCEAAQSQILFSQSKGELNTGGTLDLIMYDIESKTTKLILKGTVERRGEYNASTSPDGSTIVFNTYQFSGWKLGIADFEGNKISNTRRFTKRPNYEYSPTYSPDGLSVAYQEFSWTTRDTDIFIADKSGNNVRHFIKSEGGDRDPAWTKDGSQIVFTSGRNSSYSIYIKPVEEGEAKLISDLGSSDFAPSTSGVEDKIAFLSDRDGQVDLFVMDLDGNSMVNLTRNLKSDSFKMGGYEDSGGWAYKTSWSPDGNQIVFNTLINGNIQIFIINSDGSNLVRITNNSDANITPYWMNK